jgi:putative SOS response-associated peptidase YedK
MCYYNGQKVTRSEYIRLKQLEKLVLNYDFLKTDLQDGFAYGMNAVLKPSDGVTDFNIVQMEWGFIPHYLKTREEVNRMRFGYKDDKGKFHPGITTLNAMAEEMLKPGKIYRQAALGRRCLILSSGFFEWRHVFPTNKRTGEPLKTAIKYPYHITVKDQGYFYMAGVWQPWTDIQTGEHVDTFAVVTTDANPLMQQVHNSKKRMPTILNEDLAYEWMFGDLKEDEISKIGKTQFPAQQMEACTIAKDFKKLLEPTEPFAYEDLPAIELSI